MAFRKSPSYLWQHPSGQWYFKRPIPPELRDHFAANAKGKRPTHIVVSLETHSRVEAEQRKRSHAMAAEATFGRLQGKGPSTALERAHARLADVRESMSHLQANGQDDDWAATSALEDMARDAAEVIEQERGEQAALLAYRVATDPATRTLKQHMEDWLPHSGLTKQTQGDHQRVLKELLAHLRVEDCLPTSVGEKEATAFVYHLNQGTTLSLASKKQRTSKLGAFWKVLAKRRAVEKRMVAIWHDHDLTPTISDRPAHAEGEEEDEDVRPLTDAEAILLLTAPDSDDRRKRTYTRRLFREMYALALASGLRLNEVCSLKPADLDALEGNHGVVIHVRKAKTRAGVRSIPVTHPAAVALLKRRALAQIDPAGWLFSECVPGGPDMKQSWHVQKALGRDRRRLGLDPTAKFHSARASFATRMEEQGMNSNHVKRYVGHVLDSVLDKHYVGKLKAETFLPLANAARYSVDLEAAIAFAVGSP
jgi:integrase